MQNFGAQEIRKGRLALSDCPNSRPSRT
uniref:Truncated caspase recruitment domain protein n=1 Tax=Ranavirus ambystoma1 TaxID=265294 RepID=B1PXN7_9VIRU|nr:truncated caspase recruitment domain protein [Ambystoma tigrinum virus]ACB11385.1 truncated caspase recruitment domain protein [Ambystoma tigrinum virus]